MTALAGWENFYVLAGSSATEVPDCQWDALRPLCYGCQMTLIRPPATPALTAPVPRAGLAVASPDTPRSTSYPR